MIVAGVVVLTTAAATAGAAAAAGSYGIYKYLKKKRSRQARDDKDELDLGQELEVYKVTETKIPPPVAPKPVRGERRATVVTVQPGVEQQPKSGANVMGDRDPGVTCGGTVSHLSKVALITRLCPNAVKVLPDPPEHGVVLSSNRNRQDSHAVKVIPDPPEHAVVPSSNRSRQDSHTSHKPATKDPDQKKVTEVIRMKTLLCKLEDDAM